MPFVGRLSAACAAGSSSDNAVTVKIASLVNIGAKIVVKSERASAWIRNWTELTEFTKLWRNDWACVRWFSYSFYARVRQVETIGAHPLRLSLILYNSVNSVYQTSSNALLASPNCGRRTFILSIIDRYSRHIW